MFISLSKTFLLPPLLAAQVAAEVVEVVVVAVAAAVAVSVSAVAAAAPVAVDPFQSVEM